MIYIFSDSKIKFLVSTSLKATRLPIAELAQHKPQTEDLSYVDVSTLAPAKQKTVLKRLQKVCADSLCGVLDPKNMVKDPAQLFFNGIHDYIGASLCKESILPKRIKALRQFACMKHGRGSEETATSKKIEKSVTFPGWKKVRSGKVYPFAFLYVRLRSEVDMKDRLGAEAYRKCLLRFNQIVQSYFRDAEALLWIETEAGVVFLLPPFAENIEAGIHAALRMALSAPIIAHEKLALPFLIDFVFALHVGTSEFAPKGQTGAIISEAVNFIYHLGNRSADTGRITVSKEAYDLCTSERLRKFFKKHVVFEGRQLFHSHSFIPPKKTKRK